LIWPLSSGGGWYGCCRGGAGGVDAGSFRLGQAGYRIGQQRHLSSLGDSVAFGYVPLQAVPSPKYRSAHSFVAYPEDVAQALHVRVWDASCPGETTASMLTPGAPSDRCLPGINVFLSGLGLLNRSGIGH
jgi:hypothetical protein